MSLLDILKYKKVTNVTLKILHSSPQKMMQSIHLQSFLLLISILQHPLFKTSSVSLRKISISIILENFKHLNLLQTIFKAPNCFSQSYHRLSLIQYAYTSTLSFVSIPKMAMIEEIQVLESNHTWTLAPLPWDDFGPYTWDADGFSLLK
ncbi:hypothetical protein CR513_16673, partial [Mucuna pruriens]